MAKELVLETTSYAEDWVWEDFLRALTTQMKNCVDFVPDENDNKIHYYGSWHIKPSSGRMPERHIQAYDGSELMSDILPSVSYADDIKVYKDGEYNLKFDMYNGFYIAPLFETEVLNIILFGNGDVRLMTNWNEYAIDRYLADGENGLDLDNIEDKPEEVLVALLADEGPAWDGWDVSVKEVEGETILNLSTYPFLPGSKYRYPYSVKKACQVLIRNEEVYLKPVEEEK